ncbi:hypothetical protein [Thaumasiovibrio subtropicus]|uniref:hypothetical protein n=1 Tax=Thaumasiovibrio subtropicus TaxID=1891207 RepID=UPI000B352C8B|nr:hypothetical protein [Thaumasiovibrio subtropicus]
MTINSVNGSSTLYTPSTSTPTVKPASGEEKAVETSNKLPDSAELQRKVAELEAADKAKGAEGVEGEEGKKQVKSFTYGALGMDHPDAVKDNDDGAYTAGQVLKAAGTIGGIIALLI